MDIGVNDNNMDISVNDNNMDISVNDNNMDISVNDNNMDISVNDNNMDINNKKRSHTQLDSRKQVIAFQDRVITINIKEAQHPLK